MLGGCSARHAPPELAWPSHEAVPSSHVSLPGAAQRADHAALRDQLGRPLPWGKARSEALRELDRALVQAAWLGDVHAVKLLLAHDPRPDSFDFGMPVLAAAVSQRSAAYQGIRSWQRQRGMEVLGDPAPVRKIVRLLLEAGADPDHETNEGETALLRAAAEGDQGAVRLLAKAGADIEARDRQGRTPLLAAAEGGSDDVVQWLLDHGSDPQVQDEQGNGLLHAAARGGLSARVEGLLDRGAAVDLVNGRGQTPLLLAASAGREETAELLLARGASPELRDRNGLSLVHHSALGGCPGLLARRGSAGAPVDEANDRGFTPMMLAVQGGHPEVMALLADAGVALDARLDGGRTLLHLAARGQQPEVASWLLARGADPLALDDRGDTPLRAVYSWREAHETALRILGALPPEAQRAAFSSEHGRRLGWNNWPITVLQDWISVIPGSSIPQQSQALAAAVDMDRLDLAELILAEIALPAEPSQGETTALHLAAKSGNRPMIALLLAHGAAVDPLDRSGATPLLLALAAERSAVLDLLLEAGADPKREYADKDGRTPLHLAARCGRGDLIERLLPETGSPDLRDKRGRTPLAYAVEGGHLEVVEALLARGADASQKVGRDTLPQRAAAQGHVEVLERLLADEVEPAQAFEGKEGLRLLELAATAGRLELVRHLVSKGVPVEPPDPTAETALHHAASSGNADLVRYLLDLGADATREATYKKRLPLELAVARGRVEAASVLLERSEDPEERQALLGRALGQATSWVAMAAHLLALGADPDHSGVLLSAVAENKDDVVRLLLEAGADPNGPDPLQSSPLVQAVRSRSHESLDILLQAGASPTIEGAPVQPLHLAVRRLDHEATESLLAADADPDALTGEHSEPRGMQEGRSPTERAGITALHVAAINANCPAAERLLAAGADPGALSAAGKTALELAIQYNSDCVALLLLEPGTASAPIATAPPYEGWPYLPADAEGLSAHQAWRGYLQRLEGAPNGAAKLRARALGKRFDMAPIIEPLRAMLQEAELPGELETETQRHDPRDELTAALANLYLDALGLWSGSMDGSRLETEEGRVEKASVGPGLSWPGSGSYGHLVHSGGDSRKYWVTYGGWYPRTSSASHAELYMEVHRLTAALGLHSPWLRALLRSRLTAAAGSPELQGQEWAIEAMRVARSIPQDPPGPLPQNPTWSRFEALWALSTSPELPLESLLPLTDQAGALSLQLAGLFPDDSGLPWRLYLLVKQQLRPPKISGRLYAVTGREGGIEGRDSRTNWFEEWREGENYLEKMKEAVEGLVPLRDELPWFEESLLPHYAAALERYEEAWRKDQEEGHKRGEEAVRECAARHRAFLTELQDAGGAR